MKSRGSLFALCKIRENIKSHEAVWELNLKVWVTLFLFCFTLEANALERCGSLFSEATSTQIEFQLKEHTSIFRKIDIFDVIEIYKPGDVLATARVVILKDYNGNYKDYRIIQSKDVRLNFDMYRFLEGTEYRLQFYAPKGSYEIHYLKKGLGIHNELIQKVPLEI